MKNNPIRIALISEHASPLADLGGVDTGGQNVYVAQLAKELAEQGHYIDVYTRKESAQNAEVVDWLPHVRVIHVKAGPAAVIAKENILQYMDDFRDNMQQFILNEGLQYDLCHANFFMSGLVASGLKNALGIPFVITFHALGHIRKLHQKDQDKFPVERLAIEKMLCREADMIIAECPQDKEDLMNHCSAEEEKIAVAPCGYSHTEFYPVNKALARKMLNIKPEDKIILQLGRMVERKGIDNVIQAVALSNQGSAEKIKLVIVGGDQDDMSSSNCPEYARLLNLAKSLGVADEVIFAGKKTRKDLKYYYAAADIFITTPWYEPFGITPLEAMACGTPVIGANVGGIKYSVADGVTGALVPPKDPAKLSQKINELITSDVLLEQLGTNALAHVKTHFTWKKVASLMHDVYRSVLLAAGNNVAETDLKDTAAA
ncbi:glycosyltransferase family 4 protein [Mucilaginibacter ginkgonis]|uniref:Glycosyltransferase family 1 protein n=1 Tax=Mucilaginibacter ginkgonis TaxID=2682091 RepID=A0A6I4I2E7_9SPHI|nr:glycosyltransferase family 1 protein [Mucilaginibacter ginkgonis]QQL50482.1 glycosyltransferase family 1 protein [Mucilaginibacter ginkgonis]